MMLYQKYAPRSWSDYVGQPKAVATVRRVLERDGFDRGAWWIECAGANNSGTGKSALAGLIADGLADPFFVTRLNGRQCTQAAVEGISRDCRIMSWNADKPFKVWIIDEAHALTQGAIDLFLSFLEDLPRHCVIIFTTTRAVDEGLFGAHDSGPFASRCHRVRLTNQGITQAYAERLRACAVAEGLDGKPISAYVACMRRQKNNLRGGFQELEDGTI